MNRLLFCEPWPVSNYRYLLDQFLDGIISLFITLQFLIEAYHFFSVLPFAAAFLRRRFLKPITFGPRLCCSSWAAPVAPAPGGAPSTGVSPPTTRTSPSCTIVPTSPAILPISSTSFGTTRYCRPPVLMTANIVFFLRVRSRPRTYSHQGCPGRLFGQSLWVRFSRGQGCAP